jgi:hypothetical protein
MEEGTKNVVHQRLEGSWGVGEAERHDQELEVPVVSTERCLLDVLGVHPHLVIVGL